MPRSRIPLRAKQSSLSSTRSLAGNTRAGITRNSSAQTRSLPSCSRLMHRLIAPDSLIPTDGKIKALAVEVTGSQSGTVAKAKAAYDYLFTNMRYAKTGSGWGRGDALWACDAKRGNCSDFHSPFIGMLWADGIPARFDIGFPLPENKDKGDIAGYHCWAEFYARKTGWIPVDISEAWKAKQKQDYFFGSVDANRVQLSTSRDIALSPKQDGPAFNYFVYPYVEVDGKPYDKLDKQFSFEEVKSSECATSLNSTIGLRISNDKRPCVDLIRSQLGNHLTALAVGSI